METRPNFNVGDKVIANFGIDDLRTGKKATVIKVWNDNYIDDEYGREFDNWVINVKWDCKDRDTDHFNPRCFTKINPKNLREFIKRGI